MRKMMPNQIIDDIDKISRLLWDVDGEFDILSEKITRLGFEIDVHKALETTRRSLQSKTIPAAQARLVKFIDAMYGSGAAHERIQEIRGLGLPLFLFVGISYTPVEITKMSRGEFQCLVDYAPAYLVKKPFPQRWMFRNELQLAVAAKASLQNATDFRKEYYDLDFSDAESPAKRARIDNSQSDTRIEVTLPSPTDHHESQQSLMLKNVTIPSSSELPHEETIPVQFYGDAIELTTDDVCFVISGDYVIGKITLIDTYTGMIPPFIAISVTDDAANHLSRKYYIF